jgi:hypothetical protein
MNLIDQAVDILKLASNIVGLTHDIKIDSFIYKHLLEDDVDETKDIYVIKGSIDDPITISKILITFEKIQKQFETIAYIDRSYYYEGLTQENNSTWTVHWGS